MKNTLLFSMLFFFISACSPLVTIVGYKSGCWHENESYQDVCGFAEKYNPVDSTYIMRTYDGWTMKVKSSEIKWK